MFWSSSSSTSYIILPVWKAYILSLLPSKLCSRPNENPTSSKEYFPCVPPGFCTSPLLLLYTNHLVIQAAFTKGRGTRDQIANISWIIEKAKEFPKNIYFCFIDYAKAFDCVDHNKLWKILKEIGILDHLTCLWRNLYAGQEATVRIGHWATDWFQIGKEVCQGCIFLPCLFSLDAEYIMRNAGLGEAQAGIKIAGRNINNLRYADDTILMAEKWRTKEPLDESERGEWKSWLKTQHSEN